MNFINWLKVNKMRAIIIITFLLFSQSISTISIYIIDPQMNSILNNNWNLFLRLSILHFILVSLSNGIYNCARSLFVNQTQDLFHSCRKKILCFFYENKKNDLAKMETNLTTDLQLIDDNYFSNIFYFFCDLLDIILMIGTLFTLAPILVFSTLVIGFISISLPRFFKKINISATNKVSLANKNFLNTISEWGLGLSELKRYHSKTIFSKVIAISSNKLENSEIDKMRVITFSQFVQGIVDVMGRVIIPLIAGILYFEGKIKFGAIVTASYFVNDIFNSLWDFSNNINLLNSSSDLRKKITNLTQEYPHLESKKNPNKIKLIKTTNLVKSFTNRSQIKYPDIYIKKGEHILLTGVSGCGKSTFLRLILGIEKPSKGKVEYYDNQNQVIIPDFDQIGYIAQDVTLFPSSIRDNITMFNDPLNNKVSEVLQKVDLDLSVKEIGSIINPDNILLSGGQKQKIILAREIIDPKSFIFLDEPTSAIDTKTTTKILKIISELPSTIIMIAHNLTPEQKLMFDREIHFSKKGSDENDNT